MARFSVGVKWCRQFYVRIESIDNHMSDKVHAWPQYRAHTEVAEIVSVFRALLGWCDDDTNWIIIKYGDMWRHDTLNVPSSSNSYVFGKKYIFKNPHSQHKYLTIRSSSLRHDKPADNGQHHFYFRTGTHCIQLLSHEWDACCMFSCKWYSFVLRGALDSYLTGERTMHSDFVGFRINKTLAGVIICIVYDALKSS